MKHFLGSVQITGVILLCGLLAYTLRLVRSGRLSPHLALHWVLASSAAIVAVLLWRWLPLFRFTSAMGDRELLMALAVIFFVLVAFLMVDLLVRISAHTGHIKRLAQELALLRTQVESVLPRGTLPRDRTDHGPNEHAYVTANQQLLSPLVGLLSLWILAVMGFYVWRLDGSFPDFLSAVLTAEHLK